MLLFHSFWREMLTNVHLALEKRLLLDSCGWFWAVVILLLYHYLKICFDTVDEEKKKTTLTQFEDLFNLPGLF